MRILIGIANANIESDLRSLFEELDDAEVVGVAPTTGDLIDYAGRLDPDIVFIHENLGPEPATQTIRDLGLRFPSLGILQISPERSSATVIRAMEAGARGVIAHPFAFDDLSSKVASTQEWSTQMRQVLSGAIAQAMSAKGRVMVFVGAKGGVGTTTMATHLALDHRTNRPDDRVCLVDLDLEKGDVSAILEVRQSVSIADLAKVSKDLSSTTVQDAMILHECGLSLLLTPADVRLTEVVTAEALRPIFALLRREFDVVIVDAGGSVTPSQASAVELADDVVVVTSADVLAVRAMRKRIVAWEALGVTSESALSVLVNKVDKTSIFPASAVAQLTSASVIETKVPVSTRALEASMNERDPRAVTEVAWWRLMSSIRRELGLETAGPGRVHKGAAAMTTTEAKPKTSRKRGRKGDAAEQAQLPQAATPAPVSPAGPAGPAVPALPAVAQQTATLTTAAPEAVDEHTVPRGMLSRRSRERGQIAVENVVAFPLAIFIALAAWQIAVIGLTFVFSSHAARVAAREYSVTGSQASAQSAARGASPWAFGDGLTVSAGGSDITVTMNVPAAGPASLGFPQKLTSTRAVVSE